VNRILRHERAGCWFEMYPFGRVRASHEELLGPLTRAVLGGDPGERVLLGVRQQDEGWVGTVDFALSGIWGNERWEDLVMGVWSDLERRDREAR